MTTRSKRSANYTRYTYVKLCTIARQWQKQFATYSKMPAWKTVSGKTVAQHRVNAARELKKIALVLRTKTVQQCNDKIKTLKSQMATRLAVKVSSSKTNTSAVKRLKAKISQIQSCTRVSTCIKLCTGIKFTSYKNPKVSSPRRGATATKRTSTRRKTAKRAWGLSRTRVTGRKSSSKYKRQALTLKKEIRQLRQRNSFMKRVVAKFRNEVSRMRRHYNTLNRKPRLRVITNKNVGKQVSNIVRFSNALGNAFSRQRKAG